jgi:hypothetical protein
MKKSLIIVAAALIVSCSTRRKVYVPHKARPVLYGLNHAFNNDHSQCINLKHK